MLDRLQPPKAASSMARYALQLQYPVVASAFEINAAEDMRLQTLEKKYEQDIIFERKMENKFQQIRTKVGRLILII